jgi:hypothetical protein
MVQIRDILLMIWQAFLSLVHYFSDRTAAADITLDWPLIVFLLALMTAWLLSGCWASSIASSRRHSAALSFVLGLLAPFAYPITILFIMDIKGAKQRRKKQEEVKAKEAAAQDERERLADMVGREMLTEDPEAEAEAKAKAEQAPERVFNSDYFERIARDEQGNPTGPWRIIFGGNEVKVTRILEPLEDVVSVEIETREGGRAKFRIPYARITECEPC